MGGGDPYAGTVTMDQIVITVGDDPVHVGDEVVLLGRRRGTRRSTPTSGPGCSIRSTTRWCAASVPGFRGVTGDDNYLRSRHRGGSLDRSGRPHRSNRGDASRAESGGCRSQGSGAGKPEIALLGPGMRVEEIQAIVLTGGSAFGLAAADGVVRALEAEGRGHGRRGPVPIVPTAVIYDLRVGDSGARPGPEEGAAAYAAATTDPVAMGAVGAGTGARVAGWRGPDTFQPGGVGSAASAQARQRLAPSPSSMPWAMSSRSKESRSPGGRSDRAHPASIRPRSENTTLVVLATDARIERNDLLRLTVRAHDAVAVCIRPGHTRYDGDVVFAVSCGDQRRISMPSAKRRSRSSVMRSRRR